MFRVDIYIVTKCSSNSKTLGKYGFVCTCAKKSGEVGKIQDTGQIKGTRHETEVKAITEALSRLNQSCDLHIPSGCQRAPVRESEILQSKKEILLVDVKKNIKHTKHHHSRHIKVCYYDIVRKLKRTYSP